MATYLLLLCLKGEYCVYVCVVCVCVCVFVCVCVCVFTKCIETMGESISCIFSLTQLCAPLIGAFWFIGEIGS